MAEGIVVGLTEYGFLTLLFDLAVLPVTFACLSNFEDNIMMASRVGSARGAGVAGGGQTGLAARTLGGGDSSVVEVGVER